VAKEIVPVYLSEGGRSIRRLRILKYILLYAGIYVSEIKSKNLSYYERKIAKRVEEEFIPKGRVRKICYTITVLEEHKEIGLPQHCAGLISLSCLRIFDIASESRIIVNRFKRAKVILPEGYELTFSKSTPVAVLVDRVLLEKKLAEKAEGKGVKILTKSTVLGVKEENNYVNVLYLGEKLKGIIVRASIVINAEGLGRRIARQVFYIDEKHHTPLKAYMEDYTASSISSKDLDMVRLYVGSTYSKGLFAWCIPVDKETVRIGVASREKLMEKYSYVKKVVDKES